MKYVMHQDVNRFAQFAVRVWGFKMNEANPEETAKEGIKRFEMFLKSIGMPTTFAEIGAKAEDIPYLVKNIGLNGEHAIGSFVKLKEEDIANIYKLAL
jgi:alcohol dehydrogenase YqhD (iron-dependent ADH family)